MNKLFLATIPENLVFYDTFKALIICAPDVKKVIQYAQEYANDYEWSIDATLQCIGTAADDVKEGVVLGYFEPGYVLPKGRHFLKKSSDLDVKFEK